MVSSQEGRMCKICTWIVAEDNLFITPTGLASHFSCFSDGAGVQGFPPGGYKCLLFFIIGCLINKSGVDSSWTLVVNRFSVKSLEHRVTRVQWFPVTVLKPQWVTGNISMQLTPTFWHSHIYQRCLTLSSVRIHIYTLDKHPCTDIVQLNPRFTCRLGCTMAMMFPLVSLG